MMRAACLALLATLASVPVSAQWLHHPTPGIPRTKDGKPDLQARAPRTRDGKPDLSGVWQTELETPEMIASRANNDAAKFIVPGDDPNTFSRYFFNMLSDFKPGEEPLRPETIEYMQKRGARTAGNPGGGCLPHGLPMSDLMSYAPFKIVQTPTLIAVMYELDNNFRQIYLDGRSLPKDPQPTWGGYSVGRWEGDTLVVDTVGFNENVWIARRDGQPHSEALHAIERFTRTDFNNLLYEVTIDDPQVYTRTWKTAWTARLAPDVEAFESSCQDTNYSGEMMVGTLGKVDRSSPFIP